jgi:predicted MFS family arabinose efflux permease
MDRNLTADRWLILAVLFVARTVMACQFQTVASTAPFLIDGLAIDYAKLGTLIGLYMLPGIFIALPGGVLGQRFGAKRVVLAGLLLMAAGGALMGWASSFLLVAAGRLISGTGAVLINVLMTKMVADWFAKHELVTAMALLITSWPLGLALGLMLFTPLALAASWSAVMNVAALLSLASFAMVALAYRDPPDLAAAPAARLHLSLSPREWLAVCLAGSIWMTYNVGYIVLFSFLPALFGAHGFSLTQAGQIVSVLGWTLIVSVPLAGFLAERLRRPNLFLVGGFAVSAVAAVALPFAGSPFYAFGVLALVLGAPAGPVMALPAQALRPENRAGGMGVYFTWYYAGMAVLPGLAGLARDLTGSAAAPALLAAAMMGLALLGLAGFRLLQRPSESTQEGGSPARTHRRAP